MFRIKVPGWLIGKQKRRIIDESPTNGDPLFLASGKFVRETVHLVIKVNSEQNKRHTSFGLALGFPRSSTSVGNVFGDGFLGKEGKVLGNNSHLASQSWDEKSQLFINRLSVNDDAA